MKRLFHLAPLALAITASPVIAQSQDDDTSQLQQQISSLQNQVNSLSDDRVRFNGFFSTSVARASNDAGYAGATEDTNVADESLMALQASFAISDKTEAVIQIVGRGQDNWDPDMEWAYLSYRPTGSWQFRAGRLRPPLFMYSDYLELGYAQPWARAPQVMYSTIPSSYVGVDAAYTHNLADSSIVTQAFYGNTEDESDGIETEFRNRHGLSVAWSDYVWTLRAVYSKSDMDLTAPIGPPVENETASYAGLGLSYDDGDWQIISEAGRITIDGYSPDTDSAYLSVGHRFGAVTPYVVVGRVESKDNHERPPTAAFLNSERTDYSIGARWDVTPGVALKADWTHATDFEDGPGLNMNYPHIIGEGVDKTNVYTIKIDAAF